MRKVDSVTQKLWDKIRISAGSPDLTWELFHENSKTDRYQGSLSDEQVVAVMSQMWESLPYTGYPRIDLPAPIAPLPMSLDKAMTGRVSTRDMQPSPLTAAEMASLLFYAYGVTRDNEGTGFARPFRVVPSGGALYPLEIYFHSSHVQGWDPGLYHYNPSKNNVRRLHSGDLYKPLSEALVQSELAVSASVHFFITAFFERSTFKYHDRGYRFILLEAGHVAQNINLVATALGLGCLNVGGYFDRQIDDILGLDGVTHSTIYMAAVGKPNTAEQNGEL